LSKTVPNWRHQIVENMLALGMEPLDFVIAKKPCRFQIKASGVGINPEIVFLKHVSSESIDWKRSIETIPSLPANFIIF